MDLNIIVLAGVLAAEPEVREFASGTTLVRCLVTVRSVTPRKRVDVIPVVLWNPRPDVELPEQRGDRVWVVGTVQRRFWAKDADRRSRIEVVAHEIRRRSDAGSEQERRTA